MHVMINAGKTYFAIIAIFFIFFNTSGQQRFLGEGYVITDKGDTLKGWINYVRWECAPRYFGFRQDSGSKIRTVKDTRYWEMPGRAFERHIVPCHCPDETTRIDPQITTFLNVIIRGKEFDLLKHVPSSTSYKYYFLREQGKAPILLDYDRRRYFFARKSEKANPFRTTLRDLAKAHGLAPEKIRIIDTATMYNIAEVVKKLNGDSVYYEAKEIDRNIVSLFFMTNSGRVNLKLPNRKIDRGNTFALGFGIDAARKKVFRHLAMRVQVEGEFFASHKFRFFSIYPSITPGHRWVLNNNFSLSIGINGGYVFSKISQKQLDKMDYLFGESSKNWVVVKLDSRLSIKDTWEIGSQMGVFNTMGGKLYDLRSYSLYVGYHFGGTKY